MLVDNDSSINIRFGRAFDQIHVNHPWIPMIEPIYDLVGDSLIPMDQVMLLVELGEELLPFKDAWIS